jgi:hypothetical protein
VPLQALVPVLAERCSVAQGWHFIGEEPDPFGQLVARQIAIGCDHHCRTVREVRDRRSYVAPLTLTERAACAGVAGALIWLGLVVAERVDDRLRDHELVVVVSRIADPDGFAPQWKNGACDKNCQEIMSACLMAHVNTYGVHYPLWLDSAAPSVGWGLPPSNFQMEGTFFGNFVVTGPMSHGSLSAPLGYYCDGTGLGQGIVAGRVGDVNNQSAPPYYNAYLGATCGGNSRCTVTRPRGA